MLGVSIDVNRYEFEYEGAFKGAPKSGVALMPLASHKSG